MTQLNPNTTMVRVLLFNFSFLFVFPILWMMVCLAGGAHLPFSWQAVFIFH